MVTLDNLAQAIEEKVNHYSEKIKSELEHQLDQTALKIVEYIKTHAPRSGQEDAFADSFVIVSNGSGIQKTLTIYSSTRGRLTHLLEFGFTHRSGRFISPRPFMRPAFDMYSDEMKRSIIEIIQGGTP